MCEVWGLDMLSGVDDSVILQSERFICVLLCDGRGHQWTIYGETISSGDYDHTVGFR